MSSENPGFDQFWHHYLKTHRKSETRAVHHIAVVAAGALTAMAVVFGSPIAAFCAILVMIVPPALAHRILERNKPTSRRRPVWSVLCMIRMCSLFMCGRLRGELERHGIR